MKMQKIDTTITYDELGNLEALYDKYETIKLNCKAWNLAFNEVIIDFYCDLTIKGGKLIVDLFNDYIAFRQNSNSMFNFKYRVKLSYVNLVIAILIKSNIKEFIYSCKHDNVVDILSKFEDAGYKLSGIIKIINVNGKLINAFKLTYNS